MPVAMILQSIHGEVSFEDLISRTKAEEELAALSYDLHDYGEIWRTDANVAENVFKVVDNMANCDLMYFVTGWEDDYLCTIAYAVARDKGCHILTQETLWNDYIDTHSCPERVDRTEFITWLKKNGSNYAFV